MKPPPPMPQLNGSVTPSVAAAATAASIALPPRSRISRPAALAWGLTEAIAPPVPVAVDAAKTTEPSPVASQRARAPHPRNSVFVGTFLKLIIRIGSQL